MPKHRALRRTAFYDTIAREASIQFHTYSSILWKLLHPVGYVEVDPESQLTNVGR